MFRQLVSRQISIASRSATVPAFRQFATTRIQQKSVVESAKDVLEKVNKKTGEVLAGGMQAAEDTVPDVSVKDALNKVNKKTGEVLAGGMQAAEDAVPSTGEAKAKAKDAAENISEKAREAGSKAKDAAEDAGDKAKDLAEDAGDKAKDLKGHAEAKARVGENTVGQGYKNLQEKGKKVESEQNRPDDAV